MVETEKFVVVWTGDDGEEIVVESEYDDELRAAAEKDAELAKVLALAAGDEENGAPADVEAVDQTAVSLADVDGEDEGVAE